MEVNNCPFCNIDKNKIVKETDLCYIIYDEYPVSDGHMLIISKRHISNYWDLTEEEHKDIRKCINFCRYQNDLIHKPDGYNIGVNIGEAAGQIVMHCHIHVIPRYKGDMEDPQGGIRGVIPSKQKYNIKPKKDPAVLKYKLHCFEYVMMGLIQWYNQWNKQNPNDPLRNTLEEHFVRLRANKMLFLLSTINEENDLLDIFDNFYMQEMGPVDGDIYDAMMHEKFSLIRFKDRTFTYRKVLDNYFDDINIEDKEKIDKAFIKLKERNFELIDYSLFELVEVTKQWPICKSYYKIGKILEHSSEPMDVNYIRKESYKVFKIARSKNFDDFIY